MSQFARHSPGPQPHRTRIAKAVTIMQQLQRRPVQQRIPPPEEENPWMKCKNCGAFGHSSKSKRCPLKYYHGCLNLIPLGLNKEKIKENQKPLNLQEPAPSDHTERYKAQTRWLAEQQRKAKLQQVPRRHESKEKPNWQDMTESCDYLRKPTRPILYQGNRKRSILNPMPASQAPVKKADRMPTGPWVPPIQVCGTVSQEQSLGQKGNLCGKDPVLHFELRKQGTIDKVVSQAATKMLTMGQGVWQPEPAQSPEEKQLYLLETRTRKRHESKISVNAPGKRAVPVPLKIGQNAPNKPRLSARPSPGHNTGGPGLQPLQVSPLPLNMNTLNSKASTQANKQRAVLVPSFQLQPPQDLPSLQPVQPHTDTQHHVSSHCQGQPLRMVFTRLHHDTWTSSFLTLPSSHTPEVGASANKCLLLDKAKGHSSGVCSSVLYEDLSVSSSEESDMELDPL